MEVTKGNRNDSFEEKPKIEGYLEKKTNLKAAERYKKTERTSLKFDFSLIWQNNRKTKKKKAFKIVTLYKIV